MVLLAVLPLFYVYGVDAKIWREITSASLPFDEVWGGTVGTLVGAWLGAVPIPLDWYVQMLALVIFALKGGSVRCQERFRANGGIRDREWQKWPVTIVTGAYLGYFVGRFVGGYLLRGKRIEFD